MTKKTRNRDTFHAVRAFVSSCFTSNFPRNFGQKIYTYFQNPFSLIRKTASLTRSNDILQGFFP